MFSFLELWEKPPSCDRARQSGGSLRWDVWPPDIQVTLQLAHAGQQRRALTHQNKAVTQRPSAQQRASRSLSGTQRDVPTVLGL